MLEAVQHAALHRAGRKDHRGDEHQPHHRGGLRLQRRIEAGRDQNPDQPGGEQGSERRQRAGDQNDPVGDRAGQAPRVRPVVRCHEPRENRNERRRQRAARDNAEQQIGQLESGVVGVQIGADAERPRDDHIAHQAHRGREGERRRDQQHVARDVALSDGSGVGHGASVASAAWASA